MWNSRAGRKGVCRLAKNAWKGSTAENGDGDVIIDGGTLKSGWCHTNWAVATLSATWPCCRCCCWWWWRRCMARWGVTWGRAGADAAALGSNMDGDRRQCWSRRDWRSRGRDLPALTWKSAADLVEHSCCDDGPPLVPMPGTTWPEGRSELESRGPFMTGDELRCLSSTSVSPYCSCWRWSCIERRRSMSDGDALRHECTLMSAWRWLVSPAAECRLGCVPQCCSDWRRPRCCCCCWSSWLMSSVRACTVNSPSPLISVDVWRSVGSFLLAAAVGTKHGINSSRRVSSGPRMSSIRNEFRATGTGSGWGLGGVKPDVVDVTGRREVGRTTVDSCWTVDVTVEFEVWWLVCFDVELVVTTYLICCCCCCRDGSTVSARWRNWACSIMMFSVRPILYMDKYTCHTVLDVTAQL